MRIGPSTFLAAILAVVGCATVRNAHNAQDEVAAKGNGVKIGYYKYAHYPNNIIYVKNTGNRALKIFGIRLGMTRAQALKASTHPSYDNGNSFGVHYAGVKVKYNRKGKISAMLYRLAPTS